MLYRYFVHLLAHAKIEETINDDDKVWLEQSPGFAAAATEETAVRRQKELGKPFGKEDIIEDDSDSKNLP